MSGHLTRNDRKAYGQWPPETRVTIAAPGSRRMWRKRNAQALRNRARLAVAVRRGAMSAQDANIALGFK